MSTIKVTNVQNPSAASAAIVLDTNGQATLNGLAYPTSGSLSGRNRIINGDMRIDQRNAGAAVTPTADGATFPVDRWKARLSQSSKYSAQRNSSIVPPGFTHSLAITSLSAYSVTAGDYFAVEHLVEGFNMSDLAWGTASAKAVTLSFWVRSSLTGTFGGSIINGSPFDRSYPFTYTISAANTWEYKSVSISGPTSGGWNIDNTLGLSVFIGLGVGSSVSGTAGSWANATLLSATGATSIVGTNGATFYITGVQLEQGSTATPFERRSYGQELSLCQRYYQLCRNFVGIGNSSTQVIANAIFQCTMRATPTVGQTGVIQVGDGSTDFLQSSTGTNFLNGAVDAAVFQLNNFSGISINRPHQIRLSANTNAITLSAEL